MDPPPTIAYADALSRHGIVIARDGDTLTITLPRRFPQWWTALAWAPAVLFAVTVGPRALLRPTWQHTAELLLPAFAAAVGMIVLRGYRRSEPLSITITADAVRLRKTYPNSETPQLTTRVLPRTAVYRVYYVPFAKSLFFRVHEHEMSEMPLDYGTPAGEELARVVRNELGLADEPPAVAPSPPI